MIYDVCVCVGLRVRTQLYCSQKNTTQTANMAVMPGVNRVIQKRSTDTSAEIPNGSSKSSYCILMKCTTSDNSNKSVFSFLRQLTTWHCSHSLLDAVLLYWATGVRHCCSIFPVRRAHSSKLTACCCSSQYIDGTQTDGQTPYRYIDPAAYYVSSVNK